MDRLKAPCGPLAGKNKSLKNKDRRASSCQPRTPH